jgi:hypothetical protein
VYDLVETPEYRDELNAIEQDTGAVEAVLRNTVYRTLKVMPQWGTHHRSRQLWLIRQTIIQGLLLIQVWYAIDEPNRRVTLVSISEVDLVGGM